MTDTWKPVERGDYGALSVYNGGKTLEMPEETCDLPANLRLCERVPDNRPRPDWSQAPDWAQWWICHGNGASSYLDKEPIREFSRSTFWLLQRDTRDWHDRNHPGGVPLGIDWRTLIQRRP